MVSQMSLRAAACSSFGVLGLSCTNSTPAKGSRSAALASLASIPSLTSALSGAFPAPESFRSVSISTPGLSFSVLTRAALALARLPDFTRNSSAFSWSAI
jgi:hypothetical protein